MLVHLSLLFFFPLVHVSVLRPVSYWFSDYSYIIYLEIQCDSSTLILLLTIALTIQAHLCFCTNFKFSSQISMKNAGHGNFDQDCIEYVNCSLKMIIFPISILKYIGMGVLSIFCFILNFFLQRLSVFLIEVFSS